MTAPPIRRNRDASGREDRWYVARVHPGQERVAVENLERQAFGAFVPSYLPEGKTKTGQERARLPLFPGYVLVQFDIAFDRWQPINSTRGVMHLLPQGRETPLPIPSAFVERIRDRMEAGDFDPEEVEDILALFTPGLAVEIIDGPLASFPAVVKMQRGRQLELLVSLFGREVPTTVSVESLKRPESACKPGRGRAA